jgi:hypothetical protein
LIPLAQLNYALDNDLLSPNTLYFNNIITTLGDLKQKWMIPIKDSWLSSRLKVGKM